MVLDPVAWGAGIMLVNIGFVLGRLTLWRRICRYEDTIYELKNQNRDAHGRFVKRSSGEAL